MAAQRDLFRQYLQRVRESSKTMDARNPNVEVKRPPPSNKYSLITSEKGISGGAGCVHKEKIRVRLDEKLRIQKEGLPAGVIEALKQRLNFVNPRYRRNLRFGRRTAEVAPYISCLWDEGEYLTMPRGFASQLIRLFHRQRLAFEIEDSFEAEKVEFEFNGVLYPYQLKAFQDLTKKRFGVLAGGIGSGKKVIALRLIAERSVRTLVVVKTIRQLYVWRELAGRFLNLKTDEIGLIGDRQSSIGCNLIIGIDRSLYRKELRSFVNHVVVDNCGAANLKIFQNLVLPFTSYILGLSALSKRSDGLDSLMEVYLGSRIHELNVSGSFKVLEGCRPQLCIKPTNFSYAYRDDYGNLITALTNDKERNQLLLTDILEASANQATRALVVSERIAHLELIQQLLAINYVDSEIVVGRTESKKLEEVKGRFVRGRLKILLVTLRSLPRLDVDRVNHLFIICPLRYEGHLSEVVGRLLLSGQGREEETFIFDYVDRPDVLRVSLRQRLAFYRSIEGVQQTNR